METSSLASAAAGEAGTSEEASGEAGAGGDGVSDEVAASEVENVAAQDASASPGATAAVTTDAGATCLPSHEEAVGQLESHATAEPSGDQLAAEAANVVQVERGQDVSADATGVPEPQRSTSEPADAVTNARGDDMEAAAAMPDSATTPRAREPECEINVAATGSLSQTPHGAVEKSESRPADVCEVDTTAISSVATSDPANEADTLDTHAVKATVAASAEATQTKSAEQAPADIGKVAEATDEQSRPTGVEAATASVADQAEVESSTIERGPSGHAQADLAVQAAAVVPHVTSVAATNGAPNEVAAAPQLAAAKTSQMFIEKLRHSSAAAGVSKVRDFVGAFPANLTRPQASRRIHDFIASTTPELLMAEVFVIDADEAQSHWVMEGLEKFVVLKLYKLLFRHSATDVREDERVDRHILEWETGGSEGNRVAKALEGLSPEQLTDFDTAAQELKKVDQYRSPRDKAVCMVNAFRFVEGVADSLGLNSAAADAAARKLLPALVVRAAPPNFFSNVEFAVAYRHPSLLSAEERRCLRGLQSALAEVASASLPSGGGREPGDSPRAGEVPDWLVSAGVTLRFEESSAGELLVAEVDELLEEYHSMARALRELSGVGRSAPAARR